MGSREDYSVTREISLRFRLASLLSVLGLSVLVAGPGAAQDVVKFDATEPFSADRVPLRAELFKPDGAGRFPAVVLMHGCGGWQPAVRHALRTHAQHLRDHGFVALNLDSFGPRNSSGGELCANDRALYQALSYRTQDAFDALRYLQRQDFVAPDNVFLMGQSNGGAVAIRAAKATTPATYNRDGSAFRGVVAYYPWCGEFDGSRVSLASPLLIFAGGKDDWVPAYECQGVRATGAELQVIVYPDAAHSFDLDILPHRFLGKLVGGDLRATQDSRERMLAFLVENLTNDLKRSRSANGAHQAVAQSTNPIVEP